MSCHHFSAFECLEIQTRLQLGCCSVLITKELELPLWTMTRELERNGWSQ